MTTDLLLFNHRFQTPSAIVPRNSSSITIYTFLSFKLITE